MKNLEIDIETYSSIDLSKCGVYKYAEAEDFEILLFGYSMDGGDVAVVDLAAGERIPQNVLDAITDDSVTKWAFNAALNGCACPGTCLIWASASTHFMMHTHCPKSAPDTLTQRHGSVP